MFRNAMGPPFGGWRHDGDACTSRRITSNIEQAFQLLGALAHPGQTQMSSAHKSPHIQRKRHPIAVIDDRETYPQRCLPPTDSTIRER